MFKVSLKRGEGFTDAEWLNQLEAAYWWEKCWNDATFQYQVKTFEYPITTCTGYLWWKKCQTESQPGFTYTLEARASVLFRMLSGMEILKPDEDSTADVEIVVGNQKGVLGWTYPNVLTEWVSRWFIDSAPIEEIAGNRAHEYMHKLGYDHPYRSSWDRPYSVPYAIGDLTEAWIGAHYLKGEFKYP